MHVAHRGLNAIVSSNIPQGKGIGVLSGFSEESVLASVNPGVRMRVDFFFNAVICVSRIQAPKGSVGSSGSVKT